MQNSYTQLLEQYLKEIRAYQDLNKPQPSSPAKEHLERFRLFLADYERILKTALRHDIDDGIVGGLLNY
ncbi:hypothetical protein [Leptospira wolffii]|uniref:hypothetical protein n=1 Tax=Leptospira wolffii TaxID=409998 RepID=UPI0002EA45E7|nr:hypothetical protein [Leptospira wolffii]EPG65795.1 hypothetical protein LEP1GSC061_2099 [Leptospira wolffii serovar Khorat str. Khorat-H2]